MSAGTSFTQGRRACARMTKLSEKIKGPRTMVTIGVQDVVVVSAQRMLALRSSFDTMTRPSRHWTECPPQVRALSGITAELLQSKEHTDIGLGTQRISSEK